MHAGLALDQLDEAEAKLMLESLNALAEDWGEAPL